MVRLNKRTKKLAHKTCYYACMHGIYDIEIAMVVVLKLYIYYSFPYLHFII